MSNINFENNPYTLLQNYSNTFNPSTTISYSIPTTSFVTLNVYDVLGNEIKSLVIGENTDGNYDLEINAASPQSGIYFYRFMAANFRQTRKMMLIK